MLQRDYLLKQLETFAKVLGELMFRRKNKQLDEALRILNDTIRQDGELVAIWDLPLEEFIERIDFMDEMDCRKWALIAEMLNEEAFILREKGKLQKAAVQRSKALHLALEVLLSDPETYRQNLVSLVEGFDFGQMTTEMHESTMALLEEYRGLGN